VVSRLNTGSNVDIAKPLMFNKNTSKVSGFLMAYRLHFRTKIRDISVKEQVQWVLLYVQGGSVDI